VRIVQHLSLEVAEIDVIEIGDSEPTDARRSKVERGGRAQAARPDDEHTRLLQSTLAALANLRQTNMPTVPDELFGLELTLR